MIDLRSLFGPKTTFVLPAGTKFDLDDTDDLRTLMSLPKFQVVIKLINNRISQRTIELVNGKETRDRIDELADLLLEIQNYADTQAS